MLNGIYNFLKKIFRRSLGFTIVELLLVIAIIGVLFTLALSTYNKRALEFKVKNTASQMQQILQAGINYYADHQNWPAANDHDNFVKNYIPNQIITDPFGANYTWCTIGDSPVVRFSVCMNSSDSSLTHRVGALLLNQNQDNICSGIDKGVCTETVPPMPTVSEDLSNRTILVASGSFSAGSQYGTVCDADVKGSTGEGFYKDCVSNAIRIPICPADSIPKIQAKFLEINSSILGWVDVLRKPFIRVNVFSLLELFDSYNSVDNHGKVINSGCSSKDGNYCTIVVRQQATIKAPFAWISPSALLIKYFVFCEPKNKEDNG